jgi:hypothetical protein
MCSDCRLSTAAAVAIVRMLQCQHGVLKDAAGENTRCCCCCYRVWEALACSKLEKVDLDLCCMLVVITLLLLLQGVGATGPDSGEVYFAPQQELPPMAGQQQQQQQQQGGRRAVSGLGEGTWCWLQAVQCECLRFHWTRCCPVCGSCSECPRPAPLAEHGGLMPPMLVFSVPTPAPLCTRGTRMNYGKTVLCWWFDRGPRQPCEGGCAALYCTVLYCTVLYCTLL